MLENSTFIDTFLNLISDTTAEKLPMQSVAC